MSCFLLPKGLCNRIERAVCSFWWGGTNSTRKIHWTRKENLFKSKHYGGLGFKHLRDFNIAMLAKQAWRLHTQLDSLIARCFRYKYFPHTDVLQAQLGHNPSYAWRSIFKAIWIIQKGGCWRIGNGQSVKIWEDHWIPSHNNFKVLSPPMENSNLRYVKDLISPEGSPWKSSIIQDTFLPIDQESIEQIPLVNTLTKDTIMWMYEPHGNYTVKSGYQALQSWKISNSDSPSSSGNSSDIWKKLWFIHTIPRHKMLTWRILNNALPTISALEKKGIQCSFLCPKCNAKIEDTNHIFMSCPNIIRAWFGSALNLQIKDQPINHFSDWLSHIIQHESEDVVIQVAAIAYYIWFARNLCIF
jgi:hypothetical protein